MSSHFEITMGIWHCESERWDKGCTGEYDHTEFADWSHLTATTPTELMQVLCNATDSKREEMTFNACDETGRIDICWNSAKPFVTTRLTKEEYDHCEATGEMFYYNVLSVNMLEVVKTPVDLKNFDPKGYARPDTF